MVEYSRKRDDFSGSVIDRVAKRASYICSHPNCNVMTIGPSDDRKSGVTVGGQAAHITAATTGGPRFDEKMSRSERHSEKNAIWLCATHAKIIDDSPSRYPARLLLQWKTQHERSRHGLVGKTLLASILETSIASNRHSTRPKSLEESITEHIVAAIARADIQTARGSSTLRSERQQHDELITRLGESTIAFDDREYQAAKRDLLTKRDFRGITNLLATAEADIHVKIQSNRAAELTLQIELATILREQGSIASLQAKYDIAFKLYRHAARLVETTSSNELVRILLAEADSLFRRGDDLGRTQDLRKAISVLTEKVLPLCRPRKLAGERSLAKLLTGQIYAELGAHCIDTQMIQSAISILQRTLKGRTLNEIDRSRASDSLSNALRILGEITDERRYLLRSVKVANTNSLRLRSSSDQQSLSRSLSTLGVALQAYGESTNSVQHLEKAAIAYRQCLRLRPRSREPLLWATTMANLCGAMYSMACLDHHRARSLRDAETGLRDALKEFSSKLGSHERARCEHNLSLVLFEARSSQDLTGIKEAIKLCKSAIRHYVESGDLWNRAQTHSHLIGCILELGDSRSGKSLIQREIPQLRQTLHTLRLSHLSVPSICTTLGLGYALATSICASLDYSSSRMLRGLFNAILSLPKNKATTSIRNDANFGLGCIFYELSETYQKNTPLQSSRHLAKSAQYFMRSTVSSWEALLHCADAIVTINETKNFTKELRVAVDVYRFVLNDFESVHTSFERAEIYLDLAYAQRILGLRLNDKSLLDQSLSSTASSYRLMKSHRGTDLWKRSLINLGEIYGIIGVRDLRVERLKTAVRLSEIAMASTKGHDHEAWGLAATNAAIASTCLSEIGPGELLNIDAITLLREARRIFLRTKREDVLRVINHALSKKSKGQPLIGDC